jgi:hypothetical protein
MRPVHSTVDRDGERQILKISGVFVEVGRMKDGQCVQKGRDSGDADPMSP